MNGCTGNMGLCVAEAAALRGLHLVPVSFSSREKVEKTIQVGQTDIQIYGPSESEDVLASVADEFPDVIVVDYTAPDCVNCKQFNLVIFSIGYIKFLVSVTITIPYAIMILQFGKFQAFLLVCANYTKHAVIIFFCCDVHTK